jgi:lipoprotein-releasing system ATP-binding protein
MIEIKNITKSYGDLQVLKGIDLIVGESEIITIVGPSGAGKTTLLQIVGTLDRPDGGSVIYKGREIAHLGSKQMAKFRNSEIGFVFQFHQLLPEFTALENVSIPAYIAGKTKSEAEPAAEELLNYLGMGKRLTHKPSELSGGEQQRVAVARALINKPSIILADEPSGNLDSENKRDLHNLFFDLREKFGQTIIIVTHDRDLAGMSDRTIEMVDGRIVDGN